PINDEFKKAAKNGREPVKLNFVVDLGNRLAEPEVLDALRGINEQYPHLAVQRLWIMQRGKLIEIELK
ncbi:MAG: hypothetical protein FWG11_08715, partial [Promicromonosporaceae bacterium]|nr:hypothetical protein [Promicromonosporaceae bacterium]